MKKQKNIDYATNPIDQTTMNNQFVSDIMYTVLTRQVGFRERKNRGRWIVNLLKLKYKKKGVLEKIDTAFLERVFLDAFTMLRWWQRIMQLHPELRGIDYKDKEELEEKAKTNLGYGTH